MPLTEDVYTYFEREVAPHLPDAWINTGVRDVKDGSIGKWATRSTSIATSTQYQPPRPLDKINADIQQLEQEIIDMLREMSG